MTSSLLVVRERLRVIFNCYAKFFFLKTLTNPYLDLSDKSMKIGSTKPQNKRFVNLLNI